MWARHKRWIALLAAAIAAALLLWSQSGFPPDTQPDGAYMRIAASIGRGAPHDCFAYLEQDAQDAVLSIRGYAQQASEDARGAYPEPQRSETIERYRWASEPAGGRELWGSMAAERGWLKRLRRDLSGVAEVEVQGERATVTTARGTRYAFRKRPNGIWGLTLFTAELLSEKERLARDADSVRQAAEDYRRAAGQR